MKQTIQDALTERGYDTLTPVQIAVSNPELEGADMLVSAQTGSGKTLGFGLAIAPTILGEADVFEQADAPLALIIAPTRELAMQVKRELAWLYAKAGVSIASCVGGMDMRDERRALARGSHVVVATPGRLRDHIMRGSIDLGQLKAVVLDEADEMLDLGFREDLEFILGESPEDRQTLLFSATVPASIAKLAQSYQRDAERVIAKSESAQHSDIDYRAYSVTDRDLENAIINTLRYFEAPNAIVFANTRAMVNRLTTRLSNRGFSVVSLSGELSQSERTHALQAMRDGRARVCVATDVAARGIDLPNLDLVVHAELPNNHETLLHRSGRTGRAGRKGVSTLIVPPKVRKKAERIVKFAKVSATWSGAPSADEVREKDRERILDDPAWHEETPEAFVGTVEQLVEKFSPEQIAGAYLKLFHTKHTAPEEIAAADAPRKPREPFGPSVWFSLAGGRKAGAEPRRILPMLCKMGDISKEDIGAIRVQFDQSFVEIKKSSVAGFKKALGNGLEVEDGAALIELSEPPVLDQGGPRGKGGPKRSGKPFADKKPQSSKPIDWNDDPAPRHKKPKPEGRTNAKPGQHKAKHVQRAAEEDFERRGKPKGGAKTGEKYGDRYSDKPAGKPKGKPAGKPTSKAPGKKFDGESKGYGKPKGAPAGKPRGDKPVKPKGKGANKAADPSKRLAPPKGMGKANSKKNKARAAARAADKGRGGDSAPRRRS